MFIQNERICIEQIVADVLLLKVEWKVSHLTRPLHCQLKVYNNHDVSHDVIALGKQKSTHTKQMNKYKLTE